MSFGIYLHRSGGGDGAAERRELGAADDGVVHGHDEEARRAARDVLRRARQQVARGEVGVDQRVDRRRVGDAGPPDLGWFGAAGNLFVQSAAYFIAAATALDRKSVV